MARKGRDSKGSKHARKGKDKKRSKKTASSSQSSSEDSEAFKEVSGIAATFGLKLDGISIHASCLTMRIADSSECTSCHLRKPKSLQLGPRVARLGDLSPPMLSTSLARL